MVKRNYTAKETKEQRENYLNKLSPNGEEKRIYGPFLENTTVNREVVGSTPTWGAKTPKLSTKSPKKAPSDGQKKVVKKPNDRIAKATPTLSPRSAMIVRLPELLEHYLNYCFGEQFSEVTISSYKKEVNQFIKWLSTQGHSLLPGDVTGFHLESLKLHMAGQGNMPKTVRTRIQSVKTMFVWANVWEWVSDEVAFSINRVKCPKVPRVPKKCLSLENFQKLIDLCPLNTFAGARRAAMLWMLRENGLRKRELNMLEMRDIDFKGRRVLARHTKIKKQRYLRFPATAQKAMAAYLALRPGNDPKVWVCEDGSWFKYHSMGQDITRLYERAGIPASERRDAFHIFRRTFITEAEKQRMPREYTMAIVGHETEAMIGLYAADMKADQAAALEDFKDFEWYKEG